MTRTKTKIEHDLEEMICDLIIDHSREGASQISTGALIGYSDTYTLADAANALFKAAREDDASFVKTILKDAQEITL